MGSGGGSGGGGGWWGSTRPACRECSGLIRDSAVAMVCPRAARFALVLFVRLAIGTFRHTPTLHNPSTNIHTINPNLTITVPIAIRHTRHGGA